MVKWEGDPGNALESGDLPEYCFNDLRGKRLTENSKETPVFLLISSVIPIERSKRNQEFFIIII